MSNTSTEAAHSPSSRWDILWYLLAGYGLYTALLTVLLGTQDISPNWWLVLQAGFLLFFLAGATWLLGVRRARFTWGQLGFFPPRWQRRWIWIVLGSGLALAAFNLLAELASIWLRDRNFASLSNISAALDGGIVGWGEMALLWFCTALIIPLAEEVFFRGAIYTWFEQRFGSWAAPIGSTLLFAVTRVTFFSTNSILFVIQSLALGTVAAIAMQRTRSLWMPIAIHVTALTLALLLPLLLAGAARALSL